MPDAPELKPCPHCGGKGEYGNCDFGTGQWIKCVECGASSGLVPYNGPGNDPYAVWNKRCDDGILEIAKAGLKAVACMSDVEAGSRALTTLYDMKMATK